MKHGKHKKEKKSRNLCDAFNKMIAHFEESNSTNLTVLDVSKKFRVQSRRVYDFFNVFSTLGVCTTQNKGSLSWINLNNAYKTIRLKYLQLEYEAQSKSMTELFTIKQSEGLGSIGLSFLLLYFYLNTKVLNIHNVSALFMPFTADRKSLERRLYLVLSIYDLVGFVRHTHRTGDYTILIDMDPIIQEGLQNIQSKCKQPCSILALLSKINDTYMDTLFRTRMNQFMMLATPTKCDTALSF